MARLVAPLMTDGGTMFAMNYHGGRAQLQRDGTGEGGAGGVVPLSRLRAGPEEDPRARDLPRAAQDPGRLRPQGLRSDAERGHGARPLGDLVDIMDVGFTCAYLATPYARRLTGTTMYVDGGVNIMA